MITEPRLFGRMPSGEEVHCHVLSNAAGCTASILDLGGIVFELNVPDRDGVFGNVSANLETVADYLERSPNFGTLVGRFGNRIAKATFTVDGREYRLEPNNGPNLLHGGKNGFRSVLWKVGKRTDRSNIELSLVSDENAQGFPGTLNCVVRYTLNDRNEFVVDYTATTDKATPVNLTQHCYFNLAAFKTPTVEDEIVSIDADRYISVDAELIPTGEIAPVEGTPFDLRRPTRIGSRIGLVGDDPRGFDHCYVINKTTPGETNCCAKVFDPASGRTMRVSTTEPGVQFYTGNFLNGSLTAFGRRYVRHAALCLETQHFPDSPNRPSFPNTILRPGEVYRHTTAYRFGIDDDVS